MSVFVGKPAPDFDVEAYVRDVDRPQPVRLREYRGKWVVLFFYPRDFTFVCPTEIQAFARLQRGFIAAGAVVLGASTDSFFVHKAWFESDPRLTEVSYPVLADTAQALSRSYGVLQEDGAALRGTFIVDPDGIVRHVQINDLGVGRNVEETLRLLRALQTGDLCPADWQPGTPTLSANMAADQPRPTSVTSAVSHVTDETLDSVLAAERAVLILTKRSCGACAAYVAEVETLIQGDGLRDFVIGKLILDERGATAFKRANRWLADVKDLPYSILYRHGEIVDRFAASRAAYLLERIEFALSASDELSAAA